MKDLMAGIDIGAVSADACILRGNKIEAYAVVPTGSNSQKAGELALNEALKKTKVKFEDIRYIVATGYGRISIPFADETVTEISCHAKGAVWLYPKVRTIIDIGGQDSKAIEIDGDKKVSDFVMNDKCAAGTGRFLEVMARTLDVRLEDMGRLARKSKKPEKITSMCAVFAESEVVSLIARGTNQSDIIAGIHDAIVSRIATMVNRIHFRKEVLISGGVAKNRGVVESLKRKLSVKILVPKEPQIIGALGAALYAMEGKEAH